MPEFICDVEVPSVQLTHFWERCVGSGHSTLALRADYQAHLKRCVQELGFQRVRFHGWFLDEMSLMFSKAGEYRYSFLNADRIIDFFESISVSPFVELSFMPSCLASGRKTVFTYRGNVTPPLDHRSWQSAVKALLSHWRGVYGSTTMANWFFEVWNEPNWPPFWTGTQADYFKLYRCTAETVKEVDPMLNVGGPATAQSKWIPEFTNYCQRNHAPLDFVSTHHYPNDPPLNKADQETAGQLAAGRRSQLNDEIRDVKRNTSKPLFYTEWNTSSDSRDSLHDEAYAAAFIVKTLLEANGLVELYSFWVFSDLFAETDFESRPFHGGFGLMTVHGISKPSYRAFQLLKELGNELLVSDGIHPTVDAWFVRNKEGLAVMLTNGALPKHEIAEERVRIKLHQTRRPANISVQRIDADHANPLRAWREMGSPEYLTPEQVDRLEDASRLRTERLPFRQIHRGIEFEITMPAHSVAMATIDFTSVDN